MNWTMSAFAGAINPIAASAPIVVNLNIDVMTTSRFPRSCDGEARPEP
jgi:hypothetical protein